MTQSLRLRIFHKLALWFGLVLAMVACTADLEPEIRNSDSVAGSPVPSEEFQAIVVPENTSNDLSPEPVKESEPEPTSTSPAAASLPDLGPAPEFTNEVWLNSEEPLTLSSLRGKAVLVEFWTFG